MSTATHLETAEAAWRWVLDQVRYDEGGPWIPITPSDTEPAWDRDGMHSGIGGLAHALAEISATRAWTDEEAALAAAIGERLRAVIPTATDVTYFDGLVSHLQGLVAAGGAGSRRLRRPAARARARRLAGPQRRHARHRSDRARRADRDRGRLRTWAELAAYAADRLLAEAEETAGRPELALRPAPARPAGQARRRAPGRDAQLVARAGRDRRRARPGRGRPGPARPGRGRPTRRRAPGHPGRPGLTGRRRPRPTQADPAQARPRRVHVELVPRPGRHPRAVRGARRGRSPRGRRRAADA